MSYEVYEESQDQGGPVQLFLFRYGTEAGEYYAYTDHTDPLTVDHGGSVGEITYTPVPVKRESYSSDGTLDRSTLKLNLDIGTDLAELFRVYPPASTITLTIYQGHIDDGDGEFLAIWAGRLLSSAREGSELVLGAEPIATQMRRAGLRRNYQYGCPHALFGPGCLANEAAVTVSATVAAIDGTVITLNSGWEGAFPPDKFVRGKMKWTPAGETTRQRMIIRRTADELTIAGFPSDLAVSDSVEVVLGCNHKAFAPEGDCQALHRNAADTDSNINQFGGQPWIPLEGIANKNPYY